MTDPLLGLNEQQRQAALATHGPVLILAGAGSGKTRALTHRIAYLIHHGIAKPWEIAAVTFTNKAAGEMKERVRNLLGAGSPTPNAISTFHSLGARLLREAASFTPRSKNFTILDTKDTEKLVRQALQEFGVPLRSLTPKTVRHMISSAKNDFMSPSEYAEQANGKTAETVAQIWPRYEELLAANDAFDFDDLLVQTVQMLANHAPVRQTLQQRWRFLHVDEYQDTNALQEKFLQLLLGPEKNICVVGDDYQAIYSWRGAKVDHILGFEERYPGCKVIHLTQNYRSTPQVLEVAGQVIAGNAQQKHKHLWTTNTPGTNVGLLGLSGDRAEAAFIRQRIQNHVDSGGKASDCAILYRTNAQSRLFEEEFLTHQIPYTIVGGFRFYERREIKDALALLQWHMNPNAQLPLDRLVAALVPRVGPKTISRWVQEAAAKNIPLRNFLAIPAATRPALAKILRAYEAVPPFTTVADLLRHLLKTSGYLDSLSDLPDGPERLENIDELMNVTSVYEHVSPFLEEVSLLTDLDSAKGGDKVTCMTLHAAKGLEFPIVFIAGCEEDLLPHSNSTHESAKIEEERRLLYVGITRARKELTLTYASARYQSGQLVPRMPSRFLDAVTAAERIDMDSSDPLQGEATLEYVAKGEWITHPRFGKGIVIATSSSGLTCVFEGYGVKTVGSGSLAQP